MNKVLISGLVSVATVLAAPAIAFASPASSQVSGVVSYNGNSVGKGVDVSVTCDGKTKTDKTDSSGKYKVTFGVGECASGDHVTATVTDGSKSGTNSVNNPTGDVTLNVALTKSVSLPEMGAVTGIAAAAVAGGAFVVVRRRNLASHKG